MRYERVLFGIAGIFNLTGAAMLIINPDFQLARLNVSDPSARWLARMLASSAATWGIAYLLIARDAQRFRDLIWLGALSKTLFAVISICGFLTGAFSYQGSLPGLADLTFGLLFFAYLWRTRKSGA
jgi:hypothetical protein